MPGLSDTRPDLFVFISPPQAEDLIGKFGAHYHST